MRHISARERHVGGLALKKIWKFLICSSGLIAYSLQVRKKRRKKLAVYGILCALYWYRSLATCHVCAFWPSLFFAVFVHFSCWSTFGPIICLTCVTCRPTEPYEADAWMHCLTCKLNWFHKSSKSIESRNHSSGVTLPYVIVYVRCTK